MKFAFLILGDFRATEDRAEIHHGSARMIWRIHSGRGLPGGQGAV